MRLFFIIGLVIGILLKIFFEIASFNFFYINPKTWGRHYCIINNEISPYVEFERLNRISRWYPLYAVTYSEKRFKKVKPGMTGNDVLDLLGELLRVEGSTEVIETWIYVDYSGRGDTFLYKDIHMEGGRVAKKIKYFKRVPLFEM